MLSLRTVRLTTVSVTVTVTTIFLSAVGCRTPEVAASVAPKQIFPGPTLTLTDGAGNRRGEIFYTVADGYRLVTLQTFNSVYRLVLDVGGRGGWFDTSRNRSLMVVSGNGTSPLLHVSLSDSGLGRNHLVLRSSIGWSRVHEESVSRYSLWNYVRGWDSERANGAVSTQQLLLTDNAGGPVVALGSDGPITVAALIYNELHQPAAFWQTTPFFESIGLFDPFGHAWVYLDFRTDQLPSFAVVDEDGTFSTVNGASGLVVEDSTGQPNTSWPESWLSLRSPPTVLPFAAWDGNRRLVWRGP